MIKILCHSREILILEGNIGGYAGDDNSLFKFMFILICLLILNNHYRGIPSVICIRYVRFLRQLKELEGRKTELSDTH